MKEQGLRHSRVGAAGRLVLAAGLALGGGIGIKSAGTPGYADGQPTGDVNCNQVPRVTDSIDAALVLQRTVGLTGSLPCEQAGDVNRDHILNAVDAALILQYDAGLIGGFPAEKEPTATSTPTRTATRTQTPPPTETPTPTPTPEPGPNYELAQGIAALINEKRQELGLNQLTFDPAIVSAANEYAKFLFDNPSLGVAHNLDGLTPTQRAKKYGYQGGVGEILAAVADLTDDYATPEFFKKGWLNSPPHYSIMTDPNATDIGVGCYQGFREIYNRQQILNICVGNLGRSY